MPLKLNREMETDPDIVNRDVQKKNKEEMEMNINIFGDILRTKFKDNPKGLVDFLSNLNLVKQITNEKSVKAIDEKVELEKQIDDFIEKAGKQNDNEEHNKKDTIPEDLINEYKKLGFKIDNLNPLKTYSEKLSKMIKDAESLKVREDELTHALGINKEQTEKLKKIKELTENQSIALNDLIKHMQSLGLKVDNSHTKETLGEYIKKSQETLENQAKNYRNIQEKRSSRGNMEI